MTQAQIALNLIEAHIEDGTADQHGYCKFHHINDVDVDKTSDDGTAIHFRDGVEFLLYSESSKSWSICDCD